MEGGLQPGGQQELSTVECSSAALLLVEPSVGLLKTRCPSCTSDELSQNGGSLKPGITIVFRRFFSQVHSTVL